jgi:LysR family glycine cleavage system transcriptional activator
MDGSSMGDFSPRRRLPLNSLRVFEAVARRRSMSAAARELHMTQGAVSQQVRRLESYLRIPLFRRGNTGVSLTPAGARLLAGATQALDSIAGALETARRAAARETIVISTVPSLASWWLLARVTEYERATPGVNVGIDVSRELVKFEDDSVDIAIRHGGGSWSGVAAERLLRLRLGVVTGAGAWVSTRPADWIDDPRTRFLCDPQHDYWAQWAVRRGVERARYEGRLRRMDDGNAALCAAREGVGVAIVPLFLVLESLQRGQLKLCDPEILGLDGGYWLVRPPEALREPVARLASWLQEAAASTERQLDLMLGA